MNKLEVCGFRVLVKPETIKEELDWGEGRKFVLAGEEWKREKAATQIGTIVSVGPSAWKGFDDGAPWAHVGDRIYFARYAGKFVEMDGEEYVILNDEDIQCIIHEGKKND